MKRTRIGQCSIYPLVESPRGSDESYHQLLEDLHGFQWWHSGQKISRAEMGIRRTEDDIELLFARSALVTACRAAGKEAIDSPCLEFRSLTRLKHLSAEARNLGFTGQLAIHPDQIATINQMFTPSEARLDSSPAACQFI